MTAKNPPLPPHSLREAYPGCLDIAKFLSLGKRYADLIPAIAKNQNLPIDINTMFLEFGSGCGLVSRHIFSKNVICVDHNRDAIKWCDTKLFRDRYFYVDFRASLPWPDKSFDIIFAPYIFTWLNEADQDVCLAELSRVIKPRGMLIILIRGFSEALRNLYDDERKRYEAGELVVVNPSMSGERGCRACHPFAYIEKHFSQYMPVVDMIPQSITTENDVTVSLAPIVIMRKIG